LGTGNDLSRVLKWGEGYIGDVDIEEILTELDKAEYINLDRLRVVLLTHNGRFFPLSYSLTHFICHFCRWMIKFEKLTASKALSPPSRSTPSGTVKYMNNYISVGCDALVTLNFHRQRNNLFFANRILNKVTDPPPPHHSRFCAIK
jgi:diacylglycerol kinase (ATP)